MKLNKKQAIYILAQAGKESGFLANVLQCQAEYKGKAAKYLKYMACFVTHGFDVGLAPFSISKPCVNGIVTRWSLVEVIGHSLYNSRISKAQAIEMFEEFNGNE